MSLSDFLTELKNKILPPQNAIYNPNALPIAPGQYVRPQPIPFAAAAGPSDSFDSSDAASLVSSTSHKSAVSNDNRSSLVGGR